MTPEGRVSITVTPAGSAVVLSCSVGSRIARFI